VYFLLIERSDSFVVTVKRNSIPFCEAHCPAMKLLSQLELTNVFDHIYDWSLSVLNFVKDVL